MKSDSTKIEEAFLEDTQAIVVSITVEDARNDELDLHSLLEDSIDDAQGKVFSGEKEKAYVIIEITKE